jgi:hypothetical protein
MVVEAGMVRDEAALGNLAFAIFWMQVISHVI